MLLFCVMFLFCLKQLFCFVIRKIEEVELISFRLEVFSFVRLSDGGVRGGLIIFEMVLKLLDD